MGKLIRARTVLGFTTVLNGSEGRFGLRFGILRLDPRVESCAEFHATTGSCEAALVILGGKCGIEVGNVDLGVLGSRGSVWDGKATAVYIPPDHSYKVRATSPVEIAVSEAPGRRGGEVRVITPSEVSEKVSGKADFVRRICTIVGDNVPATKLLVGETYCPQGKWSSYPPHKHDEDNLPVEADLEELYYYRMNPECGFGMQALYTGAGCGAGKGCEESGSALEEAYIIKNNYAVFIDRGYHPLVVAPGYELYYLWAMAGDKRALVPSADPIHVWVYSELR